MRPFSFVSRPFCLIRFSSQFRNILLLTDRLFGVKNIPRTAICLLIVIYVFHFWLLINTTMSVQFKKTSYI